MFGAILWYWQQEKFCMLGSILSCVQKEKVLYVRLYSVVCALFDLFVWFLNVLVNYKAISRTGPKTERLTILRAATHESELGDHNFCLSRSHYTDT